MMMEIDELMEEDLRMFEEMNRRKAEKPAREEEEEEGGVDLEGVELDFDDGYYD